MTIAMLLSNTIDAAERAAAAQRALKLIRAVAGAANL